ncbi:MAG: TIGR02281 family clan AA aspartic protease [Kiloniellales bacterium]
MHQNGHRWDDDSSAPPGGRLLWQTLRNVGAAVIVCLLLVAGVGWIDDGAAPERAPDSPQVSRAMPQDQAVRETGGGYELVVTNRRGGHFLVDAVVNDVAIEFLVDTGASTVILTPADARRLGFELEYLEFTERFQTANGVIEGAPVTLQEMRIGELELDDVDSTVVRSQISKSLLGMTFLSRLDSYEVVENRLILRW